MSEAIIEVEEFKTELDRGQVDFILDLRHPDEFGTWRIEGEKDVETLNIPQLDFVGEEEKYIDKLPADKTIVTVCAHGGASEYVAEYLRERGFKARGLAGGMDAWALFYQVRKIWDEPEIYQVYRIAKGCVCHILISKGEALVIDPIRHIEHIAKILDRSRAKLVAVIDTHLQADHVSGGRELAARYKAQYFISPVDTESASYAHSNLVVGTTFTIGDSVLRTLHTPGHTPGSSSLLLDDKILFSGDTIMKTTVGRPDLGGMVESWAHLLYKTLFVTLKPLADATLIFPSHAASVKEIGKDGAVRISLGEARTSFALFSMKDEERFCVMVKEALLENPARYQDIRKVNLGILAADEAKLKELEIGKNLCGMAGK